MAKKHTSAINEYHLNLHQPTKKQFAMYDLGPYLEEYGEWNYKQNLDKMKFSI